MELITITIRVTTIASFKVSLLYQGIALSILYVCLFHLITVKFLCLG